MDRRIKERRRSVQRGRGRRRLLWLGYVALALAGLGCWLWLRSSEELTVARIIAPVTERVSEADIRAALEPALGVNLLRVVTPPLEGKLRSIPYVREAHVYRRFPDALEVRVREYTPFGRIFAGTGDEWIVGDDGRVLEPAAQTTAVPEGPVITPEQEIFPEAGQKLPDTFAGALQLLALLREREYWTGAHPVAKLLVDTESRVTMVLAGGPEVRLGDPVELQVKLDVAQEVVEQWLRRGRALQYVDVQVWDRPVAMPRSE